MIFANRTQAGQKLAQELSRYEGDEPIVYALPRGGVIVADAVAQRLDAPVDLVIARKIGHPNSPEYAIGAVTESGEPVWDEAELAFTEPEWRDRQVALARHEAKRRRVKYQGDVDPTDPRGKVAIIVDDGIATGLTMAAAIKDIVSRGPRAVIAAAPVAPDDALALLTPYAEVVALFYVPTGHFSAVGAFYERFPQVEDDEVRGVIDAYRSVSLAEPLDLEAVNTVLATIKKFPVTSGKIASRAKRLHAPTSVVTFFESIPSEIKFQDKADVMRRSEETKLLKEEQTQQRNENLDR